MCASPLRQLRLIAARGPAGKTVGREVRVETVEATLEHEALLVLLDPRSDDDGVDMGLQRLRSWSEGL